MDAYSGIGGSGGEGAVRVGAAEESDLDNIQAYYQRRLQSEWLYLRKLLPEELWLSILEGIDDAQDIYNLCDASSYFCKLLRSKLNRIQFPAVLEQLINNVYEVNKEWHGLALQQLLKMRAVCKDWKNTVDDRLLADCDLEEQRTCLVPRMLWNSFIIDGNREDMNAEEFLAHFSVTHEPYGKNPFCTRRVRIDYHFPEVLQDNQEARRKEARCLSAIQTLLRLYGSHVWYMEQYSHAPLSFQQFVSLTNLMELTPNLKSVCLRISYAHFTPEQWEQITFPEIPNRQGLTISVAENLPVAAAITQAFLTRNHHDITNLTAVASSDLFTTNLPNLKYLSILNPIEEEHLLELEQHQLNWPLEKLCVKVSSAETFYSIGQRWGATLKELEIVFDAFFFVKEPEAVRLVVGEFPQLESLDITFHSYSTWGFISNSVKNLKYLRITHNVKRGGWWRLVCPRHRFDKWMKALKNPLDADLIWETFPKLETLTCEDKLNWFTKLGKGKVFTRAGWEKRSKAEAGKKTFLSKLKCM